MPYSPYGAHADVTATWLTCGILNSLMVDWMPIPCIMPIVSGVSPLPGTLIQQSNSPPIGDVALSMRLMIFNSRSFCSSLLAYMNPTFIQSSLIFLLLLRVVYLCMLLVGELRYNLSKLNHHRFAVFKLHIVGNQ